MGMEALGGNCAWFDRFAAHHAAIAYYWIVVALFVSDPRLAYNFSLLVEEHAHVTYAQFVDENAEVLRRIPPPPIATRYYVAGDLYYFDKFHTCGRPDSQQRRRPPCAHLLDVFRNIRDDELEHSRTMRACQDWLDGDGPSAIPDFEQTSLGDRREWLEWSARVNSLT